MASLSAALSSTADAFSTSTAPTKIPVSTAGTAASMSPSAQDAAERAKLPDWRDTTRASTRTKTYENAETKLHKNMEKLDEHTLRQVVSHISTEDRHSFSQTCTTNYNLMNMYTGRFIYNGRFIHQAEGNCFLACSLYDYKKQKFVLYRPAGLKFSVVVIDGNLASLDPKHVDRHCPTTAKQTRSAMMMAVKANPSRLEIVRLRGITSDQIIAMCEQIPDLCSLHVSRCFDAPIGHLISKDSLARLKHFYKFKHRAGLEPYGGPSNTFRKFENGFVEAVMIQRDNLPRVSYDMEYLQDFYESGLNHSQDPLHARLKIGIVLEFVGIIKAMHACGHAVFKDPAVRSMIHDMGVYLSKDKQRMVDQDMDFMTVMRKALDICPDDNVDKEAYRMHCEQMEDTEQTNEESFFLSHLPQMSQLENFWLVIRDYLWVAEEVEPESDTKGLITDMGHCLRHGFLSICFFPPMHATLYQHPRYCYQCSLREPRWAYSNNEEKLRLEKALAPLEHTSFEELITPIEADLGTNADKTSNVATYATHLTLNFLDSRKEYFYAKLGSDSSKVSMSHDLAVALFTELSKDHDTAAMKYHEEASTETVISSDTQTKAVLHRKITDENLEIDDICPFISGECLYSSCDKLKVCANQQCVVSDCGHIHGAPCQDILGPSWMSVHGPASAEEECNADHNGRWIEASTKQRRSAHKRELRYGTEEVDLERKLMGRVWEERKGMDGGRFRVRNAGVRCRQAEGYCVARDLSG